MRERERGEGVVGMVMNGGERDKWDEEIVVWGRKCVEGNVWRGM